MTSSYNFQRSGSWQLWLICLCMNMPSWTLAQTIRYVNVSATGANNGTSWVNAYNDPQNAINAAVAGDKIWIAAGVYKPTRDRFGNISASSRSNTFSISKKLSIYGGFNATETTLTQRHLSQSVTTLNGDIGVQGDSTDNTYNLIWIETTDSVVIDGFTITRNNAPWSTSGAIYNKGNNTTIKNCIFKKNDAEWGAAIYNQNIGTATQCTIANCLFTANHTPHDNRGIIYNSGGAAAPYTAHITNCTFANDYTGGIRQDAGITHSIVKNCIFYNSSVFTFNEVSSYTATAIISNSLIPSMPSNTVNGGNNLFGNPSFANAANDDFSLLNTSPAINTGTPIGVPTTDILGNPRIGNPDMGAYESTICAAVAPTQYRTIRQGTNIIVNNHTYNTTGTYRDTIVRAGLCDSIVVTNLTVVNCAGTISTTISSVSNTLISNILGGRAPFMYLWNTQATTSSIQNIVTGTYSVTVTDSLGCTANGTINYAPSNPDSSLCVTVGNNYTLTLPNGTVANQYNWYLNRQLVGVTLTPTLTINALRILDTGQYSVRYRPANLIDTIEIKVVRLKTCCVVTTDTVSKTVRMGVNVFWGGTYRTTTGIFKDTIVGGNYKGCDSIRVLRLTVLPCNLRSTITQLGNRANAVVTTQGVLPYTYLWWNGATTAFTTVNSSGNYAVTVTDSIGCVTTATTTLSTGITNYRIDSTTVGCQDQQNAGCTPIILTRSISNVSGFTIRLRFDPTKVKPDTANHYLGRILPARDSIRLFQTVSRDTVILTISLQGWRNVNGNLGDTLLCFAWLPVGNLLGTNPTVTVAGTIDESVGTGGITTHPLTTTVRITPANVFRTSIQYQADPLSPTSYNTANNPTRVLTGVRGQLRYRGNVSNLGIYVLSPWNGDSISFMRKSLIDIGLPQIGGNDVFRMSLVVGDLANAERSIPPLLAMDVNGDGVISAGDMTDVLRRAVNYQTGFKQANVTADTMSWRHFPKSYLANRPDFKLSTSYPNSDGIGISRHRIPKIDTLFRPQNEVTCDSLPLEIASILLGDADGNFKNLTTDRKGKLSGIVRYDARNNVAMGGDTFRMPIYADDLVQGFDCKIENYPATIQILAVSNAANTELTTNIDVANKKCFISGFAINGAGIAPNTPIGYLTIKGNCLTNNYLGNITSFINGQTAGSDVVPCVTGTNELRFNAIQLYPNPTTGVLTVEYEGISVSKILIFNAIGSLLQSVEAGIEQTQLDMTKYADGVYFVKVQDKMFKVVKR